MERNFERFPNLMLYRAEKPVPVCELAPLCGVSGQRLASYLGRTYLAAGEWVFLPTGKEKFLRLTSAEQIERMGGYETLRKKNGAPVLYFGCPVLID